MILLRSILKHYFNLLDWKIPESKQGTARWQKQVPKESLGISLSKGTNDYIFQNFKVLEGDVNIATNKELA